MLRLQALLACPVRYVGTALSRLPGSSSRLVHMHLLEMHRSTRAIATTWWINRIEVLGTPYALELTKVDLCTVCAYTWIHALCMGSNKTAFES